MLLECTSVHESIFLTNIITFFDKNIFNSMTIFREISIDKII